MTVGATTPIARRAAVAAIAGLALALAGLVVPISAHAAASFSGVQPAPDAMLSGTPFYIALDVDDASKILQTSKVEIDGVPRTTFVDWPGHWEDPDCMENWITDDYTAAHVSVYVADNPLGEGTHTAKATIYTESSGTSVYTWTFTIQYPPNSGALFSARTPAANTTVTANSPIRVSIESSANVSASNCSVYLDDVRLAPFTSQPAANKVSLQTGTIALKDGVHTVKVTALDANGVLSTETWTFVAQIKPTVTVLSPAIGSTVLDPKPLVAVNTADNTPGQVRLRVRFDGVEVFNELVSQGRWDWTPASNLVSNTTHSVNAEVTDAAGNTNYAAWTFNVVAAPPMSNQQACSSCHAPSTHPFNNCSGCHAEDPLYDPHVSNRYAPYGPCYDCHGTSHAHGFANSTNCLYCHTSTQWTQIPRHNDASVTAAHVNTALTSRCQRCHSTSLVTEHAKYPSGSDFKYQCTACHPSADPTVKTAIASGQKDCSACHGTSDHPWLHTSITSSGCFGSGCHPATKNLADVHALYVGPGSERPQYASSCALCHDNPAVNTATSGTACTPACHDGSTHSEYSQKHSTAGADPKCTNCHGTDLATVHRAGSSDWGRCDVCHASRSNWNKTGDCAGCHGSGHPHPAAAIAGVQAGDGHLCTECHSTDIVTEHSKSTSDGSADACATCHAPGGARDKITGPWDLSCTTAACHGESSDQPMHTTYCGGCHENENTDFSVKQTDFAAPVVTKTKCLSCHDTGITNAGSYKIGRRWVSYRHLSHSATDECAYCHYWEPRRTEFYTHTVKGAYGFFASVDSTSPAPARAHSVHVNGSWAASLEFAPQIYCRNCHAAARCGSCHETATMPSSHANHGTQTTQTVLAAPGAPSYTSPKAALVPETRSCTAAACHGSSATQVPTCTSCHTDRVATHW